MIVLKHDDANVYVEKRSNGKYRIDVELTRDLFIPIKGCETSYPVELISRILETKGPSWLCDEILREESPDYVVQKSLKYDLLSYQDQREFKDKRLLDFGCGSGSSTMVLARMFPDTEIVGVELEKKLLSIARLRARHYGYGNVGLMISPDPGSLPAGIGQFDYVVLSAVYEHLLPEEREPILRQLWSVLKPGGILFLNQTPYIGFPIETHTTSGLPFINYLSDRLAYAYARRFSRRKLDGHSWKELLRMGIRGASEKEVLGILDRSQQKSVLLEPSGFGVKDRIDLWYIQSRSKDKFVVIKRLIVVSAKLLKMVSGLTVVPYLSLAIRKSGSLASGAIGPIELHAPVHPVRDDRRDIHHDPAHVEHHIGRE
jgi:2-polyprenyl-3-methyl-5-hydroxy-6-metoxy-1,4-benzoquinol methylase